MIKMIRVRLSTDLIGSLFNQIKRVSYLLQAEPKMGYNGVDSVEKTQNAI